MPRRTRIDRAAAGPMEILRYMRPNVHFPQDFYKIA
jgi:hypothetical protein